jgi:hypothetical protein
MRSHRLARGVAIVAGAFLFAGVIARATAAPGEGGGSGSDAGGDIEMEPDVVGPGSGAGSATDSAAGSGSATPATPSAPVKDPKIARTWLSAAQQLVAKGDYYTRHNRPADAKPQYENAITAYQKAIEAGDDVSVNYALALVEDKLGGTPAAYHHLKLVIAAESGVKPDIQKKAQAKLDELAGKVGLVTLQVTPDGTAISISGKSYGDAPLADALVLEPGTYTATFTAAGFQPKDAELKVEAGSESLRKIELDPIPIAVKPHIVEAEPEPEPAPPAPSKLPLYVGAGATGVLLLTATITGISAISQHHAFTDPTFSESERKDAQSLGHTMEHVTDVCLVGMIGAAAFTAYWYQYRYRPALDAPPPGPERRIVPKVDMIPWVQPDAGGLVVVGSY